MPDMPPVALPDRPPDEAAAKRLLDEIGIAAPGERVCPAAGMAAAAGAEIGFPVVMKIRAERRRCPTYAEYRARGGRPGRVCGPSISIRWSRCRKGKAPSRLMPSWNWTGNGDDRSGPVSSNPPGRMMKRGQIRHVREKKRFFYEKKRQKTFAPLGAVATAPQSPPANQSFFGSFLFTKKNVLLAVLGGRAVGLAC
jgi:hypothetical protein